MAYAINKMYNGIQLSYWKITQRNMCSGGRVDWVVELSGYTSQADRESGTNPFFSKQIVFTDSDHPVTEADTEALLDDSRDFDSDTFNKHVFYIHISRIASLANAKAGSELSEAESACLFFFGAMEA